MSGTLRIERLALRYRISPRHPAPALAQASLDRDLGDRLPTSCAAAMAATVPDGEGLIVIRRLDLQVGLTAGTGAGRRLGTLCARAISRGVARALAGELGPDRVARYRSPADHWACFLFDLARGTAAERWQYASFVRLWSAPVGAAFRAAPDSGVPVAGVLTALARRSRLGLVAAAVSEADASGLLEGVDPVPGSPVPPASAEVLSALADPATARLRPTPLALFLAGTLAGRHPSGRLDELTLRVARLVATVAVALRSLPASPRAGTSASGRHGPAVSEAIAELERTAPEVAASIRRDPRSSWKPMAMDGDVTPFGGLFALLPALAELDGERRLTPVGRHLVLAKCLPAESRATAWHDPALNLAAANEAPPQLADLRALRAPPPPHPTWAAWSEATLRAFARRLPGFERSSPAYLARNFLLGAAAYGLDDMGIWASVPQVPLRLVLRMSAWGGGEHLIPWLPGGRLRLGADQ